MSTDFDYCILGAGLAGISLAHELLKKDVSVCLLDPVGPGGGASGTPLGLVNPATGRFATKSWRAELCLDAVRKNLEWVQSTTNELIYKGSGVLRPALTGKIASRMQENLKDTDWPDDWVNWLDEKEVKNLHPGIECTGGGVWVKSGMTVDIGAYLKAFIPILKKRGLQTYFGKDIQLENSDNAWVVSFGNDQQLCAEKVICATGAYTSEIDLWSGITIHPVKGQLAVLESGKPVSFDHAVSALGYVSSLGGSRFIIGSTYEHTFEDEQPDEEGLDYLLTRFAKVLPELRASSSVIERWAGVRASTPNRMPVLGQHPEHDSLFIYTGLGSKGLMYSAYGAQLLSDFIFNASPLPEELCVDRFFIKKKPAE